MLRPFSLCKYLLKAVFVYISILYMYKLMLSEKYNKKLNKYGMADKIRKNSSSEYGRCDVYDYAMDNDQVKTEKIHQILYWTSSYMGRNWFGTGQEPFSRCHYTNCNGTIDKEAFNSSQAVLFHLQFMKSGFQFPKHSDWKQQWIVFNHEPPPRSSFRGYNGIFNATMTYHRNSEIWANYSQLFGAKLVKRKEWERNELTRNYGKNKTKLIAWFVGDCGGYRRNYVRNLQKYVPVDIYGRCGPLKCKRTGMFNNGDDLCNQMLDRDYKFYLAFENCICEDYVTEKLWKSLLFHTVPIVMGGYNYSEYLPANAYIDVKDYSSPEELAKYLTYLNHNNEAYNAYFDFHRDYKFEKYPQWQCEVCRFLNEGEGGTKKTGDKIDDFWSTSRQCASPEVFYPKVRRDTWKYV